MHKLESSVPKEILWAEELAYGMDGLFKIPFTNFRFGLDPIIGIVPWVGDGVSFAISMLILKSLVSLGLPKQLIWKMFRNIAIDFGIGLIPVIGNIWDFFFRANRQNLKLLREYFDAQEGFLPEPVNYDGAWPYILRPRVGGA
jgi:hypothetical protein